MLQYKTLAMIFNMPSTRTSISFETAMTQLGGHAMYLFPNRIWADKANETWADTIGVISRFADGIIARVSAQSELAEAARVASIPVINGSTDYEHPCQALTDFQTALEKKHDLKGLRYVITWGWRNASPPMGLVNSSMYIASKVGVDFVLACPEGYEPDEDIIEKARADAALSGGSFEIIHDQREAVAGADIVNVYNWVAPAVFREKFKTEGGLAPKGNAPHLREPEKYVHWRLDSDILKLAKPEAKVMHCMPAARDQEVTNEVLDGPQSVILDEAENRLHVQKAILALLMA